MKPRYDELYAFVYSLAAGEPRNVEPEVDDIIGRATALLTEAVDIYVVVEGGVVQSIRSKKPELTAQVIDLDDLRDAEARDRRLMEAQLATSQALVAIW